MPDYVRNYYSTNATPADDTLENLIHDLKDYLCLNAITPDEKRIKLILTRRGIETERQLVRVYGPVTPFAAFMQEYQSEVCKTI